VNLPTKLASPRTTRISLIGVLAFASLSLPSLSANAESRNWKDQVNVQPTRQWDKGDKTPSYSPKDRRNDDHRGHGSVRYDGDRYRNHYGYHQRPYHYGKPRGYIHRYQPYRRHVVRIHNVHHWRTGRWHHGHHHGRVGWWWVVGNAWYHYARQTYPYPDHTQAVVYVQQPVPVAVAAPAAAPTQYWYYCDSSETYYPYVSECAEGWQAVPATPDMPAR
jgi:hypothetical protein